MTDFTPEQIRKIRKLLEPEWTDLHISEFIQELTKIRYAPTVDEVYAGGFEGLEQGYYKYLSSEAMYPSNARPLTPNEVPGWKRDKEKLKIAVTALGNMDWKTPYASEALKEIERLDND